jgi:hypothetical protein
MSIKRPDLYEHNNPNEPFVDTDFVKGGFRTKVADLTALYALSPKVNQMKEHATSVWVVSEAKYYTLVNASNVGNSAGWSDSVLGSSNTIVVSSNITAKNDTEYSNVANATYTDPSPVEGKGYEVKVVNGTATIGSTAYTEGMIVTRTFHSGSWRSKAYVDLSIINTALNTKLDKEIVSDTASTSFNISTKNWNDKIVELTVTANIIITIDQFTNVLLRKIGSSTITFVSGAGRTIFEFNDENVLIGNYAQAYILSNGTTDVLSLNDAPEAFIKASNFKNGQLVGGVDGDFTNANPTVATVGFGQNFPDANYNVTFNSETILQGYSLIKTNEGFTVTFSQPQIATDVSWQAIRNE